MSLYEKMAWLFGGVGVVLVVASLVAYRLSRSKFAERQPETLDNLKQRIKAWWVMVAVFAVCFTLGKGATIVLFAFTSFFALREFISLTPTRPSDNAALVLGFYILLPLQYWLIYTDWYGFFSVLIPVYGFLTLGIMAALKGETIDFLPRIARVQWGLMLAVYCISHAPALLTLPIAGYEGQNFLLLFFLITVVQASDVLQYVFGKMYGHRKVAPNVSPSKTWEGLIGGGLAAALVGTGLWWITPFEWWQAWLMSVLIVALGFFGGLTLSAVKRSLGAKDWGVAIQGHGGVLDRMDSVSFAAPVFFHATRYFFGS